VDGVFRNNKDSFSRNSWTTVVRAGSGREPVRKSQRAEETVLREVSQRWMPPLMIYFGKRKITSVR
jgi:hypothetical protein